MGYQSIRKLVLVDDLHIGNIERKAVEELSNISKAVDIGGIVQVKGAKKYSLIPLHFILRWGGHAQVERVKQYTFIPHRINPWGIGQRKGTKQCHNGEALL